MNNVEAIKKLVVDLLSSIAPESEIRYLYKISSDTHFFEMLGVSIYDHEDIMLTIDNIYQEVENKFPELNIAIVDESAISNLEGSTTLYNGKSVYSSIFSTRNESFPLLNDSFLFGEHYLKSNYLQFQLDTNKWYTQIFQNEFSENLTLYTSGLSNNLTTVYDFLFKLDATKVIQTDFDHSNLNIEEHLQEELDFTSEPELLIAA